MRNGRLNRVPVLTTRARTVHDLAASNRDLSMKSWCGQTEVLKHTLLQLALQGLFGTADGFIELDSDNGIGAWDHQ